MVCCRGEGVLFFVLKDIELMFGIVKVGECIVLGIFVFLCVSVVWCVVVRWLCMLGCNCLVDLFRVVWMVCIKWCFWSFILFIVGFFVFVVFGLGCVLFVSSVFLCCFWNSLLFGLFW